VREANINNAAGHRLYVTLVPVSHRRFLRASVRVNHPRVAAIRTAEQALVREIARHVATWSEWLLARTADKPEQRDRGRRWSDPQRVDRKSTRLNSSHVSISYAVFCLKKKKR